MTIKTLKEFLLETTVPPKYHHVAQEWDHQSEVSPETHAKMQKAMDRGHFTTFPLSNLGEGDPDVVEHLVNHGWDIKDYQKGIAQKKIQVGNPERGIPLREKIVEKKIGSILDETKASDDVKKTFTNQRGQTNADEYHVCVSNSPLAILGMSTGTSWDSQSCMRYPEGINHHYLPEDSAHGTHVAYLVHSSDKGAFEHGEPDKPIARIVLKPHHYESSEGKKDTIFRPELRTYGAGSTAFSSSVSNWAVKNYPALKNVTYNKNEHVYDDTGNNAYESIGEEQIKNRIDNESDIVYRGSAIDNHVIDAGLEHFKKRLSEMPEGENKAEYAYRIARKFSDIGNLSSTHVSKILKHITDRNDEFVTRDAYRDMAMKHGDKFSSNAINEYIKNKIVYTPIPSKILAAPKLPDSIVDDLDPQKYMFVRQSKIKPHHLDKLIDAYNEDQQGEFNGNTHIAPFKNKFSGDQISKLIKHADDNIKSDWTVTDKLNDIIPAITTADNFTKEHHQRLVNIAHYNGSNNNMENIITNSKYASINDFPKYRGRIMSRLMENPNLSDDSAKELKDNIVDTAEKVSAAYKEMGRNEDTPSQTQVGLDYESVPEKVTKHFTDSDYDRLADTGLVMKMESAEHSNKYLDAIHRNIKKHDEIYHQNPMPENANELNKHITRFGEQLAEHVNDHVYHGTRSVKNTEEFENVYQRLRGDSNDERSITSMKSTLNPYGNPSLNYAMSKIPQKMQPIIPK